MSVATIDSLIKIDPAFANLIGFSGAPPLQSISSIITKYSSYTVDQLDLLFNHLHPKDHKWWQSQYLRAHGGLTPIIPLDRNAPVVDYYGENINDLLNNPIIKAIPDTYVILKTEAGILSGTGSFEWSLQRGAISATTYESKEWVRLLCSIDIEPQSKWTGPTFLHPPYEDYTQLGKALYTYTNNHEGNSVLTNDYFRIIQESKYFLWQIIRKSSDRSRLTKFINDVQFFADTRVVDPHSFCSFLPNSCSNAIVSYIKTNPFNDISNRWCDVATTTNRFSSENGVMVKSACSNAYAIQNCKSADTIYKSNFISKPSTKYMFESFSASCPDACQNTSSDSSLYEACKVGAIEYCKLSENITTLQCISDASKYPELNDMKSAWCSNNTIHPNYHQVCIAPAEQVVNEQVNNQQSGSSAHEIISGAIGDAADETINITILIVIIISVVLLIAGGVGLWFLLRKRKGVTSSLNSKLRSYNPFAKSVRFV